MPLDRSEASDPAADDEPRRVSRVVPSDDAGSGDPGEVELELTSGDELEIARSTFRAGEPVMLSLGLPTSPAGPLSVRVIASDGRVLETTGAVREQDPTRARVEIEQGWLGRPGRYIVELNTKERTHFPLRRYAIEVR